MKKEQIIEILKDVWKKAQEEPRINFFPFDDFTDRILALEPSNTTVGMSEDLDNAWPLRDVLAKLREAADILLHKKDYDGHGWEAIEICMNRADEILSSNNQQTEGEGYCVNPITNEDSCNVLAKKKTCKGCDHYYIHPQPQKADSDKVEKYIDNELGDMDADEQYSKADSDKGAEMLFEVVLRAFTELWDYTEHNDREPYPTKVKELETRYNKLKDELLNQFAFQPDKEWQDVTRDDQDEQIK